jgi:hypothetical protein
MALNCRGFLALGLVIAVTAAQNSTTNATVDANYDVLKYVNQLIGSNNGGLTTSCNLVEFVNADDLQGNVFPGATLPFGKHL